MDTAPDAPGANCQPWVLTDYDGGDILLNGEKGIVMSPKEFPNLKNYIGQDLILTDGTTLLGGDDKAAIAAVMTMAEHLLAHPELPHGPIALAFTPDEEVGGLARDLDLERFGGHADPSGPQRPHRHGQGDHDQRRGHGGGVRGPAAAAR